MRKSLMWKQESKVTRLWCQRRETLDSIFFHEHMVNLVFEEEE
jgi:hypothetical protein